MKSEKIFAVAPMMEWTDRHCRYFHRRLTRRALLYTEMVTSAAVIHGDRNRLLGFHPDEQPVALQLGGSDPAQLAQAARIGEDYGYSEINLNVGCPSDRVQNGQFGACLMAKPHLVAECIAAMREAVHAPVTVKCRIGIDDQDSEADLDRFVNAVSAAGCETFIVHARKAWLNGLSPKENRDVPPLDYARVRRLKLARPRLTIVLNGGIQTLDEAEAHLAWADGVMLGRAAYQRPALLAEVDARFFGASSVVSLFDAYREMIPYCLAEMDRGGKLSSVTRHMLGLFQNMPGARAYRRALSEDARQPGAGLETLLRAIQLVEQREERLLSTAA
jgi:tRNA-dihydrouridine synthase A